ncbi:phosphoserine phosphatase SerB [Polymorphobacter sp. PAMC 29334]|uniref:phosphoserine phosphatase SerB n=1 Tax=Polymorphobacter sp. PAMC 29334 TaxID=2862331 RepID=UPI001C78C8AE|nr:phosphoserine phosphatase SerB [Polymorphobacter sp. PAMC 29334]QYE33970.1 phosphoserine phosphatase SerB [Polymorphobacter sp. PAMC 29334]
MLLATLIAAGALSPGDVAAASDALRGAGGEPGAAAWLDAGDACDLTVAGLDQPVARAAVEAALTAVDIVVQPVAASRRKRLLIADMDSTMIQCECIDELADYAGLKPQVAAITEAAMRGELDFAAALDARVALLKGMDARVIDRCRAERVRLMPGAKLLVATMARSGARTILVSGGFTAFAGPVGAELGFDRIVANRLLVEDGKLTGTVSRPIIDAATKRFELDGAGVPLEATIAVGDGANDIPMLERAGLGIAYHAKPKATAAADAAIRIGDLTALLWAQGYKRGEWVSQ